MPFDTTVHSFILPGSSVHCPSISGPFCSPFPLVHTVRPGTSLLLCSSLPVTPFPGLSPYITSSALDRCPIIYQELALLVRRMPVVPLPCRHYELYVYDSPRSFIIPVDGRGPPNINNTGPLKKICLSSTRLDYPFALFHTQRLLDSRSRPTSDP